MSVAEEKVKKVLEHIKLVQENCYKLGFYLMEHGEEDLGRRLIANGQIHDNSKFHGIEIEHLVRGDELLPECIRHHVSTNPHHPEYWGGIQNMPKLFLYEAVAAWKARSTEFGSDLRAWIEGSAMSKFHFYKYSDLHSEVFRIVNILCEVPF